jgi:hypothetical protein
MWSSIAQPTIFCERQTITTTRQMNPRHVWLYVEFPTNLQTTRSALKACRTRLRHVGVHFDISNRGGPERHGLAARHQALLPHDLAYSLHRSDRPLIDQVRVYPAAAGGPLGFREEMSHRGSPASAGGLRWSAVAEIRRERQQWTTERGDFQPSEQPAPAGLSRRNRWIPASPRPWLSSEGFGRLMACSVRLQPRFSLANFIGRTGHPQYKSPVARVHSSSDGQHTLGKICHGSETSASI